MPTRKITIHVVYGVLCVGKSTGALALAHHEGIRTVVHTDYLREVQRRYVRSESAPVLAKVTHNAWELYGPPTRENILTGFVDHVTAVSPAIETVAAKLVSDGFDAIIEGAHFYSQIITGLRDMHPEADVSATLLVARTATELRQRAARKVEERAEGTPLHEWTDNIGSMITIQDYLIADARANGIPVATADEWRDTWDRHVVAS
jgi:2-phosphoglycerate kinase